MGTVNATTQAFAHRILTFVRGQNGTTRGKANSWMAFVTGKPPFGSFGYVRICCACPHARVLRHSFAQRGESTYTRSYDGRKLHGQPQHRPGDLPQSAEHSAGSARASLVDPHDSDVTGLCLGVRNRTPCYPYPGARWASATPLGSRPFYWSARQCCSCHGRPSSTHSTHSTCLLFPSPTGSETGLPTYAPRLAGTGA